jgi:hypothetical protein
MRAPEGSRGPNPLRDQGESAFTPILRELLARVPGARAAALVDFQGETVDYAGRAIPFELRVAAAHWRIVLNEAEAQHSLGGMTWLAARAARRSYLVYALPDRYALVVVLARAAGFAGWHRAVAVCARALGEEAAWSQRAATVPWFPVEVVSDGHRRPQSVRVAGRYRPLEILGTLVWQGRAGASGGLGDLARREKGWRVRLETGAEATLVREPGGVWYADAAVDGGIQKAPMSSRRSGRRKSR